LHHYWNGFIQYELHAAGYYNAFLHDLKRISPAVWDRVDQLLCARPRVAVVESVVQSGRQAVFDLAIADTSHAFGANGLVVHNCAELAMWAMETGGLWQPYRVIWPRNRVSPTDIVLTLLMDPRFVNRATFWEPVPGLELGPHER
jgi:hypothetical protein